MKEAVIVSTARTPIAKAYRGAFNHLAAPTMGAIPVKAAVQRAGIDPAEIDDCIFGAALQQGMAHHPRTTHAIRMTNRNRTTVYI